MVEPSAPPEGVEPAAPPEGVGSVAKVDGASRIPESRLVRVGLILGASSRLLGRDTVGRWTWMDGSSLKGADVLVLRIRMGTNAGFKWAHFQEHGPEGADSAAWLVINTSRITAHSMAGTEA